MTARDKGSDPDTGSLVRPLGAGVLRHLLPQRPPLLMVDSVQAFRLQPRPALQAARVISVAEPWLAGHFPGLPVLPGALIIEGLAQSAGLLITLCDLAEQLRERGCEPEALAAGLANLERGYRLGAGYQPERSELVLELLAARRASGLGVLAATKVKLLRPVFPGERVSYQVTLAGRIDELWSCRVSAEVAGRPVADGSLSVGRLEAALPGAAP